MVGVGLTVAGWLALLAGGWLLNGPAALLVWGVASVVAGLIVDWERMTGG